MDNTKTLQKLTALFLVFIMLFGIIVPNTVVFAEGKLNNKGFTDKAPDSLVQAERDKKVKFEEMLANILDSIAKIQK